MASAFFMSRESTDWAAGGGIITCSTEHNVKSEVNEKHIARCCGNGSCMAGVSPAHGSRQLTPLAAPVAVYAAAIASSLMPARLAVESKARYSASVWLQSMLLMDSSIHSPLLYSCTDCHSGKPNTLAAQS